MGLSIPSLQAIKFLQSDELTFNEGGICGCDSDEKWAYLFTSGDNICFQMRSGSELGDNTILNDGFEEGESSTSITNWARDVENSENTNVTRELNVDAPCGSYYAKWANVASTPTFAQLEQSQTFIQGKTYKVTFKAKIETGGLNIGNILRLKVGGQEYFVTPSEDWEAYTLIVTFNDAPSNPYFDISMNEIPTDVQFMYVDCVTMQEYSECSLIGHVNNGCFELGQRQDEDNTATFDNWTTDGSESLTGGYDGGRCVVLGIGQILEQDNSLTDNTHFTLKFWARADGSANIQITTQTSGTIIDTLALTTTWTQYTYRFYNLTDSNIKFEGASDENVYLDCVELSSRPEIDIYITDGETIIPVSEDTITAFDGGVNICIPVDDYAMPECFRICVETCLDNLFLNGNFAEGSGNVFTSWTLTQPSRTNYILRSNDVTNASWGKLNMNTPAINSIIPTATNAAHRIEQDVATIGVPQTMWCRAKANGYNFVAFEFDGQLAYFNLGAGSVGTVSGGTARMIADVNNAGYYYCLFSLTPSNTKSYIYVTQVDNVIAFAGNTTSGILIDSIQVENGLNATPNINTTNLAITTSLGEFLQDATGGIGGNRAMKLWADSGSSATYFRQSISIVTGTNYTLRLLSKYIDLATNGTIHYRVNGGSWVAFSSILTDEYEQLTANFTALVTGAVNIDFKYTNTEVFGFAIVDEVDLLGTSEITEICSENMKFSEQIDSCAKELVWYDTEAEALGIDYASGFKNRLRIKASLQNPQYSKESISKTLNGDISSINAAKVRKSIDLGLEQSPEFIWDSLSGMIAVSNIEYNGVELCSSEDTEINAQSVKDSRLINGTITLNPKGEYIVNRVFNCD